MISGLELTSVRQDNFKSKVQIESSDLKFRSKVQISSSDLKLRSQVQI